MLDDAVHKFGIKKKKGEIIFCEFEPGNTVYFIKSGTVRLTKIVGDKEKSLAVIGAGDIFGEMAILEKAPRSATAICDSDSLLLEFNKESFAQLCNAQPSIAVKLLQTLAARIHDQKRKFKIITLPDNESKIMDVFLMLAEKKGINPEHNAGPNLDFEVEVSEVANWAGIPEQSCDMKLREMANQSKLGFQGRNIRVVNLYQFFRHVLSKRSAMERDGD